MAFDVRNAVTRLTNWEYWPLPFVYIPIYFYWFILSIRARSFFFFTASNPGIEYGGMLGESKIKIFEQLPTQLYPRTRFLPSTTTYAHALAVMEDEGWTFPLILKPDVGERGWLVAKIDTSQALRVYLDSNRVDLLLQEYVDLPLELGVFYYRFPGEDNGKVTSIVKKKMLSVIGDGTSTVKDLLLRNPRGRLQVERLLTEKPQLMESIPKPGEQVEVVPIGNHRLGTAFLNANAHITPGIHTVFDKISSQIPGFYFGRFDIRCGSWDALENGELQILELNGAGAEPAHIYHPGFPLWKGYAALFSHWTAMFKIARLNHRNGVPYLSLREGLKVIQQIRTQNKIRARS